MRYQWDLLLKDYNEASEYIEDLKGCDDFEELCQRNLAANTGLPSIKSSSMFTEIIIA